MILFAEGILKTHWDQSVPVNVARIARAMAVVVTPGAPLALVSTMAGNLLIVGSIANLIVVDAAARCGITIDWRRHARTGVPVTLVTLAVVAGWLALR